MTVKSAKDKKITLYESQDIEVTALYVYDAIHYRGFVVRLANHSTTHAYEIDLPRFRSPGNVLRGARNLIVDPKSFTLVFLVYPKK